MKKCKRWIAVLLVSLMCLSLCGCQNLDDMRASHAFWQEDGSILWNGDAYVLLEDVPKDMTILYGQQSVYVTKPDVPVLLSQIMGEYFDVNADGALLCSSYWAGDDYWAVYCREDKLAELENYLQQGPAAEVYYYGYYTEDGTQGYYYLTDDQRAIVDKIAATVSPGKTDDDFYMSFEDDEYCITLGGCDKQHLFGQDYLMEIVVKEEGYYLVTEEHSYAVPPAYKDTFADIVQVYYENEVLPYIGW